MDPRIRIRIHPKMSWIRNTGRKGWGLAKLPPLFPSPSPYFPAGLWEFPFKDDVTVIFILGVLFMERS
jgi:hypothetical protein